MTYRVVPKKVKDSVVADLKRGDGPTDVAKRYGLNISTVRRWGASAGVPARDGWQRYTEAQKKEAVSMKRNGVRYSSIQAKVPACERTIRTWELES